MFLTRMELNPARRGSRKLLGSPQAMHAAVLAGFPPSEDAGGRVLWRVDQHGPRVSLYVSSPTPPDLTHLIEQAGWPTREDTWRTVEMNPGWQRLSEGQKWAFRLTANPVKSLASGIGNRGKVRAILTVEGQEEWLVRQAERHGFEIPWNSAMHERQVSARQLVIEERQQQTFVRGSGETALNVTLNKVTYSGALIVRDPQALREMLAKGLGRGKAYGCGLMTLARVE